jgi:kynureninase
MSSGARCSETSVSTDVAVRDGVRDEDRLPGEGNLPGEGEALARDAADPLSRYRDLFFIPDGPGGPNGPPAVYLAGQSLGLQSVGVQPVVDAVLRGWARGGIDGMFTTDRPWFTYDDSLREPMARIVGARPSEVAFLNTLTVNIHVLLTSFFQPSGKRRRILADAPLFPSDRHALTSHLAARGLDPVADLIVVAPRTGEATLRSSDIEGAIVDHADELALVFLAGVNFATGQAHDIGRLTAAGRAAGAVVGWDLAHAAGNISLELHDWDVDFAAWCTYKYLNGGPGSIGALFVHDRHGRDATRPRLTGWWGTDPDRRFEMDGPFVPSEGAAGWKASTNPVLALAPLVASLEIFDEVGMPALRARSVALTAYLEGRLDGLGIEVITPRYPAARGAQLSLRFPSGAVAEAVLAGLVARGVVADFRGPDIIRLAPVPLYNTYHEAWQVAGLLGDTMAAVRDAG